MVLARHQRSSLKDTKFAIFLLIVFHRIRFVMNHSFCIIITSKSNAYAAKPQLGKYMRPSPTLITLFAAVTALLAIA